MAIKKRSAEVKDVGHLAAVESSMFANMMSIVEHCALLKYEDGTPREPGWVTIKTNGSAWTVQVKDPDTACTFAATADTIDKALETAALLLSCDDTPWERDRFLVEQQSKKAKKK